ncbi:MAG: LysR family transcriptional regulator [Labilithrix sp.]|nr:LysR family transcriptional regulator [Labilithrix sp.]
MHWDDLRLALAVAETGSAASAGRRLGVAHTTVSRRLAALEKDAGALFFERVGARLVPTDAGRAVLTVAADFAQRIGELDRALRDEGADAAGLVTVTCPELVAGVLVGVLPRLRARHPALRIRLRVTAQELDLARREADVAVRVNPDPDSSLVGQRVGWTELARYGTAEVVARGDSPWVCFDEELAGTPQAAWEAEHVPSERVALRTNSRSAFIEAVRAGVGVGLLPRAYAQSDPSLVESGEPIAELRAGVWVITHESTTKLPRVRAVARFLVAALREIVI